MNKQDNWKELSAYLIAACIDKRNPQLVPPFVIHPMYRDIYEIVTDLIRIDGICPWVGLTQEAGKERASVIEMLKSLEVTDESYVRRMLPIVASTFRINQLVRVDLVNVIERDDLDPDQMVGIMMQLLVQSTLNSEAPSYRPLEEVIQSYVAFNEEVMAGKKNLVTLPDSLGELNDEFAPMPGDVIMVSGYTGDGKSRFLMQEAWHLARNGFAVLFCSVETTSNSIAARTLSGLSGITPRMFRNFGVPDAIKNKATKALQRLPGKFWVYEGNNSDVGTLLAVASSAYEEASVLQMPFVIIVDYLQTVSDVTSTNRDNFWVVLEAILLKLKEFAYARETNVVLASQISDKNRPFGGGALLQKVQAHVAIAQRDIATADLLHVNKDGNPFYLCPIHGMTHKTKRDLGLGITLCPQCGDRKQSMQPVYLHRAGGRSADTTISLAKNNDGDSSAKVHVRFFWFDLINAFVAGKPKVGSNLPGIITQGKI